MSTISSSQIIVPQTLSHYLSNTKKDSKKLLSAMEELSSETDTNKVTSATEKFVKYYNSIIHDNTIYSDSGIKSLTKEMKSLVNDASSSLSALGITVQGNGKLKLDKSTLKTAVSDTTFSTYVSASTTSGGFLYNLNSMVKKLYKDNTYYLSTSAKNILSSSTLDTYA